MKFNRESFFAAIRTAWGGLKQKQVDALNALLDFIEADEDMTDPRWVAYVLATVKHETAGTYLPIAEYGKGRGKPYGKRDPETKQAYFGRAFVQLTHRDNYEKFSDLLGLDLVNHPDLALEPETAYLILTIGMRDGLFTGRKLSHYINEKKCDYVNARRIVNAMDKAALIAGYAKVFEGALEEAPELNGTEPTPTADSEPVVTTEKVITKTTETKTADGDVLEKIKSTATSIASNQVTKDIASAGVTKLGTRLTTSAATGSATSITTGIATGKMVLIIIGIVLLLIAAGYGGYVLWHKHKKEMKAADTAADKTKDDISFLK